MADVAVGLIVVADHSVETPVKDLDVSNAVRRDTSLVNAPTRVDTAAKEEPPQNASNVARKDTSPASAPRVAATSASIARRRVTSHAIVRPSGR